MKHRAFLKKSIFTSVFLVFIHLSGYSADGIMWGQKDIRVISTKWFDIIYTPESSESAVLLYENADRIYYEIAELYGREPQERMPVVLSSQTEQFNAYFSTGYYNHIVLYDTSVTEDLAVFTNDLLSTFRHELTHAYTYNLKNKFWSVIGDIFGEAVNPAGLFVTSGLAEGATVTSESSYGEGRLNDEYALHIVKQAKLEGKFPFYSDVQGSSDKYPFGSYYYFNGVFDQWLQKKYGMEKYAAWWYKMVNFQTVSQRTAFKNVYGIRLKDAWKEFENEFEVPDICLNPMNENTELYGIKDFFSGSKETYSKKNNSGAVYKSLTSGKTGIAFIESSSDAVWFQKSMEEKPKKIFTLSGINSIKISEDGRYMAASFTDSSSPTYRLKIKIYDMEKHFWINVPGTGIKDAAIFKDNGDYFIVSQGFKSGNKWIDIKKILGNRIEDVCSVLAKENEMPFSFCFADEGEFAYILKSELTYKICISDKKGQTKEEILLPYDRMVIRNLFYDSSLHSFVFSWTKPGTMPRYGTYIRSGSGLFFLSEKDFSGGVFNPIHFENSIIYAGHFYRQNRLFCASSFAPEIELTSANFESLSYEKELYITVSEESEKSLEGSKKYNPFVYMKNGLFLPVSLAQSVNFDSSSSDMTKTEILPLGLTYITNNPWSSNVFTVTTGYSPFTNSFGCNFLVSGGTDTSLFKWSTNASCEFDMKGFKQTGVNATETVTVNFGNISSVSLNNLTAAYYGKSNPPSVSLFKPEVIFNKGFDLHKIFYVKDSLSFKYSNVHKTGTGLFEYGGFSSSVGATWTYSMDTEDTYSSSLSALNLNGVFSVYIPKLIPLECPNFFVYNLPAVLAASIFPRGDAFLSAGAKVYLFSMDIQKAVPFLPGLFLNRFYFTFGYNWSCLYEDRVYQKGFIPALAGNAFVKLGQGVLPQADYLYLKFNVGLTPNFGAAANSLFYTELNLALRFDIRDTVKGESGVKVELGLSSKLF